ncbi:hypothetical protein HYX16_04775 [Candidatus Woesearchaeota archaeon]|nr:hypothetical protein [Candidatus Woesearchaeota archaeon]
MEKDIWSRYGCTSSLAMICLAAIISLISVVIDMPGERGELERNRNLVPRRGYFVSLDYEKGDLNHDGLGPDFIVEDKNGYKRILFKQPNGIYESAEEIKRLEIEKNNNYKTIEDKLNDKKEQ